jgi:hypothetical protein
MAPAETERAMAASVVAVKVRRLKDMGALRVAKSCGWTV